MTKLEREMRADSWIRSEELLSGSGSRYLASAIKALDKKSFEELALDFRSDKFRFFNLTSGAFAAGGSWCDIPRV